MSGTGVAYGAHVLRDVRVWYFQRASNKPEGPPLIGSYSPCACATACPVLTHSIILQNVLSQRAHIISTHLAYPASKPTDSGKLLPTNCCMLLPGRTSSDPPSRPRPSASRLGLPPMGGGGGLVCSYATCRHSASY
eukprot:1832834-Rhodomonas_salina.4